ncbi:phage exclusion protein Lit family protein [Serratia marcescens]|uniref:phage exclusion protein Lit family protein n=1 Tax=Serratia marcescens TaxID=615 RepID=UPI0040375964
MHEIRHIRHQREETSAGAFGTPECKRNEELSCDEFATKFVLEKMQDYSAGSGDDFSLVRRKRELGVYLALFSLTLLSKDKWEESDSHPSVQERINSVCEIMGHDRDETASVIAHAAFATLRVIWPSAPMVLAALA